MVIPSRWFAGGKGLDDFRAEMLSDRHMRMLIDYENASEVFPGVDIAAGVCYFLYDRDSTGPCRVTTINGDSRTMSERFLDEFTTLIRHGDAVSIIRKIITVDEPRMSERVSSRKPFGLSTTARPKITGDIKLRWQGGIGPYNRAALTTGVEMIDQWKVITSKASHDHGGQPDRNGLRKVLATTELLEPGIACTETYIVAGSFRDKTKAENLLAYLKTRFARFLIAQVAHSLDITKSRFKLVPDLDMSRRWNDADLAERYGLTPDEVAFIESKIRAWE